LALKDYKKVLFLFENAAAIDPSKKMVLDRMYDVSYQTKIYSRNSRYNKLIEFDPKYKEDLTSLYMGTNQFEKALVLIQELNETLETDRRDLKPNSLCREISKY
jgi:tetratricopeptide (TPR) repeat protein